MLNWLLTPIDPTRVHDVGGIFRGSRGGPSEQPLTGTERGDHYDMTQHRVMFEFVHKTVGYTTLGLITFALFTGLWAANAPIWMWLCIVGWICLLLIISITLQLRGYAYDTYQAIWGPDLQHPGNNLPKQGVGVVRPSESSRFKCQ